MEKSEPLLKSLVLQLVNVSESCVSEICVESFEVLDEKGNHIQEFDVANCHITPTYLRGFENCYLKFKNDELLDHIGAHPETIIIIFTCEDQMYNKYRFEISGAIDYWRWEKKGTKEVNPKWKVKFIGIY